MKKRQVGTSELFISEVSLGCMTLPANKMEAEKIIHTALDAGINYFDTADLYQKGENEALVGEILKPYRKDIILATKVGNRFSQDRDDWTWDPSASHIKKSVKDSLSRLQTDYIDLYQLHGGTLEDDLEEVVDTFEELKKEGYIREYGISSIRPNVFVPFSKTNAVSNMMHYNMLERQAEEFFDELQANGVSVLTRGTVAKGVLTSRFREKLQDTPLYAKDELMRLLEEWEQTYSIHALAFAFNLKHEAVASVVVGASKIEQLEQSIAAYKEMPSTFPNDVLSKLKIARYEAHR